MFHIYHRVVAGGEGDNRGWDGWMASLTRWTWVWVNSRSRWWTGRPGMLWFMGSRRVGHDWATELNWTELSGFRAISASSHFIFSLSDSKDTHPLTKHPAALVSLIFVRWLLLLYIHLTGNHYLSYLQAPSSCMEEIIWTHSSLFVWKIL